MAPADTRAEAEPRSLRLGNAIHEWRWRPWVVPAAVLAISALPVPDVVRMVLALLILVPLGVVPFVLRTYGNFVYGLRGTGPAPATIPDERG